MRCLYLRRLRRSTVQVCECPLDPLVFLILFQKAPEVGLFDMEDMTEPFGDELLSGEVLDDRFLKTLDRFSDDFLMPFRNAICIL